MSKELNCMNCSIGDFKHELCDCDNGFCKEFKSIGKQEDFFNAVIQRIRPQGEWIPVSERLPEGDDDVLVTVWWGYGNPEVWVIDYAGVTRGAEEGQIADEKILAHILAWQPLPEPYKGGDTE